jgi:hypothetical protein
VRYDPVKQLCVALAAVTLLAVLLAVLFSSPDERPSTIAQWARRQPIGFLTTAISELSSSSPTAEYGPPYNHNSDGEHAAFLSPQKWLGVSHPVDTVQDFVIDPVRTIPNPKLQAQVTEYVTAAGYLKEDGIHSFERELRKATVASDGSVHVQGGEYENVNNVMKALLSLAQSGGLDGYLLAGRQLYRTDYTKQLLFMMDGGVLQERAEREHLPDGQWAMMNETGGYPGQAWLWLYAFWYGIEPFKASHNVDILVMLAMAALSLVLVCVPFLPGVRGVPRLLPLYRLIWREHYRASS